MKTKIFIAFILGAAILFIAAKDKQKSQNQITVNDNYNYIAINNCMMWVSNNGDGSHDPRTDASGFYWPGGENAALTAVFEDGLVWGGYDNGLLKAGGSMYRQGLQAGKILEDGTPDDPSLEKYRVYKIRKNWELLPLSPERDSYEKDYNEWPVEDGAPWIDVDGDGVFTRGVDEPEFIGDETLWFVSNDLDPERTTYFLGSLPIGFEVQTTVFAFSRANLLGDAVFKRYKIINKSNSVITDLHFGYWSDSEVGNAGDDFVGCDTLLNLGYGYNGDDNDDFFYWETPPAVGYNIFERPVVPSAGDSALVNGKRIYGYKNVEFSAFISLLKSYLSWFPDPSQGEYEGTIQLYNYLLGNTWNGERILDPNTGEHTTFCVPGDPVAGTGWYEGGGWPGGPSPGDRRLLYSTGAIDFAPADTQNILLGVFMARGEDRLSSVAELKNASARLQEFVESNFQLESVPSPALHSNISGENINLYWDSGSEDFQLKDVFYSGEETEDTLYKFEGYRVWQYSDKRGYNPVQIGVFDIKNQIRQIFGYQIINGKRQFVELFTSPDEGLQRNFSVETDYINNSPLVYEKEYYFGVTAYAYFPGNIDPFLESDPRIIKVVFKKPSIDYSYDGENRIIADQIEGAGSGFVRVDIVDPDALTGHNYKVKIYGADSTSDKSYSLFDETTNDTLLWKETSFIQFERDEYGNLGVDSQSVKITDGFKLLVTDLYVDSLMLNYTKYYVSNVEEIKGPGGAPLEEPANVWDNPSPNGGWYVTAKGEINRFIWQMDRNFEGLGFYDYEIRFDRESQFYATGYSPSFFPLLERDPLGKGTVPFSVWDIGQTPDDPSDDKQLLIKVLDFAKDGNGNNDPERAKPDSMFSQLENGDWEEIYVFRTDLDFNDLPETSPRFEAKDSPFGAFVFNGDLPQPGTVIRLSSVKPLTTEDVYTFNTTAANFNDTKTAKEKINEITVFPNPYYAPDQIAMGDEKVTFARLPNKVKIRIYSLSGHLVKRLDKDDNSERLDWFLNSDNGESVNNGIYIAHLEMEGIGEKIIKIAVVK